ncbi:fumarylacetoacetate hydrolase family protein [Parathalassolituus penaei]|uniref:Fumarylacetoacetate hydrolase family protein n=1 Tax=Parathalassolituus penaei TaxID=2997323 RepID=A0A9X3EBX9_9GAMM|nr:fumarylacetoacetate hydrolase family protein [Parathalassolituus penaei]MCY0964757.1 fumarylacetoacetate hydrolase family protein [Parathalassolituus penaei]
MFIPQLNGQPFAHAVGKIVCVGRNYAAHALELNNPIPDQAILFIKPASAAVPMSPAFSIPTDQGSVHHELEIAILIGQPLSRADQQQAAEAIAGVGLGIDLTLRDVQDKLKAKGQPWERAKAFDGAAPLSTFVDAARVSNWQDLDLSLVRNGAIQQQGNSSVMLFPILALIAEISQTFALQPGDVILTGTPAGVGPLLPGDRLEARLADWLVIPATVQGA